MRIVVFLLLIFNMMTSLAQISFRVFFTDETLRIDYFRTGDATKVAIFIDELIALPQWAGTQHNLIDKMNCGPYLFSAVDQKTQKTIFTKSFSSLFFEWQSTDEAKLVQKGFSESVLMPMPKEKITAIFSVRSTQTGEYEELYHFDIDPSSYLIKQMGKPIYPSRDIEVHGNAAEKIDIVILPEGYILEQMEDFVNDCKTFTEELFSFEPYRSNRNKFNIKAVLAPSNESGADIPKENIWKNTLLNCQYYTFDSERYLMTTDNKKMHDIASTVPYDQIYILVNNAKYGGGGIFNQYCTSVNNNKQSAKIHIHEFSHAFAGLADEYEGDDNYGELYNLKLEPLEPNITTLINFQAKWKNMLPDSIPVPTPKTEQYKNSLGVFEGAGYMSTKIYRPMQDCLMRSFNGDLFCPVCERAIVNAIDVYSQQSENQ